MENISISKVFTNNYDFKIGVKKKSQKDYEIYYISSSVVEKLREFLFNNREKNKKTYAKINENFYDLYYFNLGMGPSFTLDESEICLNYGYDVINFNIETDE